MKVVLPDTPKLKREDWYDYLLRGFKEVADIVVESKELVKDCFFITGKMVIPIDIDGRRVWYDWSDFAPIHPDVMGSKDRYFKVQYYPDVVKLTKNVFPIGGAWVKRDYFTSLDERRKLKNQKKYDYDIIGILSATNYELRKKLVIAIKSRKDWKSLAWLVPVVGKYDIPNELLGNKLPYDDHLEKQCRSKLCLAICGRGTRFCIDYSRIVEILSTGNCLILPKLEARIPHNLKGSAIFIKRDFSDLDNVIDYYLTHNEEREEIAKNGLEYYEKWLSPTAIVKTILRKLS